MSSFIKRYYGRHKGSGKSKATVISDGQVTLFDIRANDVILEKNSLETPPYTLGPSPHAQMNLNIARHRRLVSHNAVQEKVHTGGDAENLKFFYI